ncbi:MAG: hypothetical protein M0P31_17645 [Solirubrobacteraceae bacterium]|nr:hypothetical protein [Solirubrobacteraceae bacterium]
MLSDAALTRLAHANACSELSDRARGQVRTHTDAWLQGAELVEDAARLVRQAEGVLELAVAVVRAQSVSWQEIGDRLEVTKQSAQGRFGETVKRVQDGILFPRRDPVDGVGLGWWAGPDGLADPERTMRVLDEWVVRHREPTDPVPEPPADERPVSHALQESERYRARSVRNVSDVTALALRILDRDLPDGVSEREAQRVLLERKIATFDAIATSNVGTRASRYDALQQADRALDELTAWHEPLVRDALGWRHEDDGRILLELDGTPVAVLSHHDDPRDPETHGWSRWPLTPDGQPDVDIGPATDAEPDAPESAAIDATLAALAREIAFDRAKAATAPS